jgi:ribonuclease HII
MADFAMEREIGGIVAGVDEVGRGPLAGPVVAAAVVFLDGLPDEIAALIDDSKKLTAAQRRIALDAFRPHARIALGAASVSEIDRVNILVATHLAMARAVGKLRLVPDALLVDGNRLPPARLLPKGCRSVAVIGGDALSLSIAAASIAAKIARDRLMSALAIRHPGYGWERNVGYGTQEHRDGLHRVGVTPHHRRSFKPLADLLSG